MRAEKRDLIFDIVKWGRGGGVQYVWRPKMTEALDFCS
jgi:hypothetical protein